MRDDYTEIAIVLDESGSMQSTKQDAIGGFNQFLEDQKKLPGIANLTLAKFNTTYTLTYPPTVLTNIPHLTDNDYNPGGGTALLDAMGRTIDELGDRLSKLTEENRPSKVIVVIITDGEENSSRNFTRFQINDKIKIQEDVYKWKFVFIGSNQDAIATAASYGISAQSSLSMGVGGEALKMSYQSLSKSVSNVRLGLAKEAVFNADDRLIQNALGATPHRKKDDNLRSGTDDSSSWPSK